MNLMYSRCPCTWPRCNGRYINDTTRLYVKRRLTTKIFPLPIGQETPFEPGLWKVFSLGSTVLQQFIHTYVDPRDTNWSYPCHMAPALYAILGDLYLVVSISVDINLLILLAIINIIRSHVLPWTSSNNTPFSLLFTKLAEKWQPWEHGHARYDN